MTRWWMALATLFAAHAALAAGKPDFTLRVGDGTAAALAVAATPDGGALLGLDLVAAPTPVKQSNAGIDLKSGQRVAAVAAYDARGHRRWVQALQSTAGAPSLRGIASAPDGSSCIVGWFGGSLGLLDSDAQGARITSAGAIDAFVLALAPDGTPRWLRGFGGEAADSAVAVAPAPDGGCYVAGNFRGSARLDGDNDAPALKAQAGSSDAFVLRLDSAGTLLWAQAFGGPAGDDSVALALDIDGVYLLMNYNDRLRIDAVDGAHDFRVAGASDALLLRIDTDGRVQSVQAMASASPDHYVALAADAAGVRVAGYFGGKADLRVGDDTLALSSVGPSDAIVLQLDRGLKLQHHATLGGSGAITVQAAALAADGRLWLGARYSGSVHIGERTINADGTDGALFGFDAQLRASHALPLGGEGTHQVHALCAADRALLVAGMASVARRGEAEREREEAEQRGRLHELEKAKAGDAAALQRAREAAARAESEREAREQRSEALLVRLRLPRA